MRLVTVRRALLGAGLIALSSAAPANAIVGGTAAAPGRWPALVAVVHAVEPRAYWGQVCGGTVIAPRRVLTAAHCLRDEDPTSLDVIASRTRLSQPGGRRIRVTGMAVYPAYLDNLAPGLDAAVLTLASDAGVAPMTLAAPGQDALWAPGAEAWTAGWGQLNAKPTPGKNNYFADRLRELQEPLAGDDACENVYGAGNNGLFYEPEWALCAGDAQGRSGTCWGDSGGPLAVQTVTGWVQVGIVEGGDSCAARGYYDLFTRVDRIRDWALGALDARTRKTHAAPGRRHKASRTSHHSRR